MLHQPGENVFVPELLSNCYKARRSGILTLKHDNAIRSIYFKEGDVVFATSNGAQESLDEGKENSAERIAEIVQSTFGWHAPTVEFAACQPQCQAGVLIPALQVLFNGI